MPIHLTLLQVHSLHTALSSPLEAFFIIVSLVKVGRREGSSNMCPFFGCQASLAIMSATWLKRKMNCVMSRYPSFAESWPGARAPRGRGDSPFACSRWNHQRSFSAADPSMKMPHTFNASRVQPVHSGFWAPEHVLSLGLQATLAL